jgi:regulator of protease activity HflC (stomatin/prohibitin superfamily)
MYWLYILVLVVILYVLGSIRVLRQYERGVVFLLGKFEGVRGAGLTIVFVPIQQMVRVSLRTVTMNPFAKNHYKGQRFDRYRGSCLLSHFRPRESGDRH